MGRGKAIRVVLERSLHLDAPWPAGCYLRAFRTGMGHGMTGHLSYLNGERRDHGWWSYFPIVASYKVPVGIGMILLLSLISLWRLPPRWAEWGLFVPMLAWTIFALSSKVNLGFRHFLPAYAFMLMLGESLRRRLCAIGGLRWRGLAVAAAAISWAFISSGLPLLYQLAAEQTVPGYQRLQRRLGPGTETGQQRGSMRTPRERGKSRSSTLEVKRALSSTICMIGSFRSTSIRRDQRTDCCSISPVRLAGAYELGDPYAALRSYEPDAVIGNSILVFDLDRLGRG